MFQDKKAAEEYDKMLELAEALSELLTRTVPGLSAELAEAAGIVLAERREQLGKACKGQVGALAEVAGAPAADAPAQDDTKPVPPAGTAAADNKKVAALGPGKRKSGAGG